VLKLLAAVVPLGLAGAFSPMMLTEQTVLLAAPGGRRAAAHYAAGAVGTLLAFATAIVLFGRTISLPQEPHLDATLDLVIGALLMLLATVLRRRRNERTRSGPGAGGAMGDHAALGFGAFSMATNITTLALVLPAAKEVAASHAGLAARTVAITMLVMLASVPAWSPVLLTAIAPGPAERGLRALAGLIAQRGRAIAVGCLAGFGVLLVIRGVVRLAGI
jgi:hypothetical protein